MEKLFEFLAGLDKDKKAEMFDQILSVFTSSVTLDDTTYCDGETEEARKNCRSSRCITPLNNIYNINNHNIDNDYTKESTTTASVKNSEKAPAICELWFSKFREICTSYAKPTKMTPRRAAMIQERVREGFSLADFEKACRNMESSVWMKGKSWASFDWIISSEDNLTKLMEGYYNRQNTAADEKVAEIPQLEGRLALLERLIRETAHHFGKKDVDSTAMASALKDFMDHDKYYKLLDDRDIVRVFHYGSARREGYEYYGDVNPGLFCDWFQRFKPIWIEERKAKS